MGIVALVILELQLLLDGYSLFHHIMLVPVAILYFEVFWDRGPVFEGVGTRLRIAVILIYTLALVLLALLSYYFILRGGEELTRFLHLLTVPAMILLAHVFYRWGLLRGGADAKSLMAIALLVPMYPEFHSFPIIGWGNVPDFAIVFPFALVTLMNAALLLVFAPLGFLIFNLSKRNLKMPEGLFGFEADLRNLPDFVWLMQRIEDGKLVRELLPKRGRKLKEEVQKLLEAGYERAWVTPQIPFLVAMTISFALSFLVGNLLLGLLSWIL